MKKTTQKILSFAIFLIGAAFLINYQTDITGSFLNSDSTAYVFSFWVGIILLILSVIIFSSTLTLERRVEVSSSIKKNPGLLRLTQETVRDEIVEREMNHLIEQLSKGNFEAGLGHPGHIEDTDVFYLRGRNGARLYYRRTGKNQYDVVGKSAKGNQDKVMGQLKKLY